MRFPQAFHTTSNYGFTSVNAGAETLGRSFMMGTDTANNTTPSIELNNVNLDLNQRMVEIRRSYVNPRRVEVQSRIDYLPQPNQMALSLTEQIRVTEIIRTREILRTKFIQSPFPDDVSRCLNERLRMPVFQDQTSHPYPFTQRNPLHDPRLQLYNQVPYPHHLGLNLDQTNKFLGRSNHNMMCYHNNDQPAPSTRQQGLDPDPISVYFDEIPMEKLRKSTLEFNSLDLTLQPPNPGFAKYLNMFPGNTSEVVENEYQDENDVPVEYRRTVTHSLPHEKYGPYTCPRCRGVFVTSQLFAAHMGAHYKREGRSERARGEPAKNNSPNIHNVHSKYGLQVQRKSFKPSKAKRTWRKTTLWLSDEESSTEEESEGGVAGENESLRSDDLFDFDVKQEPA